MLVVVPLVDADFAQIEGLGKRAIDAFMADATRELQRIRGAM